MSSGPGVPPAGAGEHEDTRPVLVRYVTALCRVCGLFTAVLIWACMSSMMAHHGEYVYTHWYLLAVAPIMTFFEITWVIHKLVRKSRCWQQSREGGCDGGCVGVWRFLLWVDDWRKGVLYAVLAVPCFLRGLLVVLGVLCGVMLLVCSFAYFIKSFRYMHCWYHWDCTCKPHHPPASSDEDDQATAHAQQQEAVKKRESAYLSSTVTPQTVTSTSLARSFNSFNNVTVKDESTPIIKKKYDYVR